MPDPSDQDLALRARGGDVEAYGELVRRYQASVFSVCYRLAGERRQAEDWAQEAFIRAYQRLHTYDAARPFGPWMRRVAANLCLNRLEQAPPAGAAFDDERDEPPAGESADPAAAHEQAERAATLRAALAALPAHYRAVIELRHFEEMSYAEIAAALNLPLSDVKSHLYRARQLLARSLPPDV
jgi:RNA polymerase sigma-70 factor (ECF subfamily)